MNESLSSWLNSWLVMICLVLVPLVAIVAVWATFNNQPVNSATIDLSWPNCLRLSNERYSQVIVGSSGGLDFRPNPCLAEEARMSNDYVLYTNTGNPGFPRIKQLGSFGPLVCPSHNNFICYSFNYGYQAAEYSMRQAYLAAAADSTYWWLDVETINSWSSSVVANRADIMGMIDAFRSSRFLLPKVGVYTANNQWQTIVGNNWRIGLPLWLGTGDSTRSQARQSCHQSSIIGGSIVLSQYTSGNLDFDFNCSPWQPKNFF